MGSQQSFSQRQPAIDVRDCPPPIREAVTQLQAALGQRPRVVQWNRAHVGVAVTLPVGVPTGGPVRDVDIREEEPVVFLFQTVEYPHKAPHVISDRPDFPTACLPHQVALGIGGPAIFCLYRGNLDDWFVEHTLQDFIRRVQGWLTDAACGRLIRPEDRFEPTQIVGERETGIAIYNLEAMARVAEECWNGNGGKAAVSYLPCYWLSSDPRIDQVEGARLAFRLEPRRLSRQEVESPGRRGFLAVLVQPHRKRESGEYFGDLPWKYATLKEFADRLGSPLQRAVSKYLTQCRRRKLPLQTILPIILAVPRPQQLLGYESSIEMLNLALPTSEKWLHRETSLKPETPILWLGNRLPLTTEMARQLSGVPDEMDDPRLFLIGVGALGSKVALHLGRAGITHITTVDKGFLSPHNLVRHALLPDSVGRSKAERLKEEVEAIFRDEIGSLGTEAVTEDVRSAIFGGAQHSVGDYDWVLDCSASSAVVNTLIDRRLAQSPLVMRAEIADEGRLGFLLIEGEDRNPRVDDLQAQLYSLALDDDGVAEWLRRQRSEADEFGSTLEDINIGLGCGSPTMRIADDIISYHAAVAAMSMKHRMAREHTASGIQISRWNETPIPTGRVEFRELGEVLELTPENVPDWCVRMPTRIFRQLQREMSVALPNEAGGILVGYIHYKKRVIYVTHTLPPPPDSVGWPYAFRLGVDDVPEQVRQIRERTGGLIGYVGEWHSHTNGAHQLSRRDLEAAEQVGASVRRVGLPTHIMIVNRSGCYSYLFLS